MTRPTLFPEPTGTAEISPDGVYRYSLTRTWSPSKQRICWVMLNPSKADATFNDATIRRVINFSRAWGYGSAIVVNLYALRATDPRELARHPEPIGGGNDSAIHHAVRRAATRVLVAWGAAALPEGIVQRIRDVTAIIRGAEGQPHCLGVNTDGSPRHPVRLPGALRPVPWPLQRR